MLKYLDNFTQTLQKVYLSRLEWKSKLEILLPRILGDYILYPDSIILDSMNYLRKYCSISPENYPFSFPTTSQTFQTPLGIPIYAYDEQKSQGLLNQ